MILQYTDIFEGGKTKKVKAEITTDHPASHYRLPVVVLPDGNALDAQSWVLLGYRIIKLTKQEAPAMERWLKNLYAMMGMQIPPTAPQKNQFTCSKCGYEWAPRISGTPKQCPNCKSMAWNNV